MSQQRSIARVVTIPPLAPGFIGPGHLHAPVVPPDNFLLTDPFIMLVDDHVDHCRQAAVERPLDRGQHARRLLHALAVGAEDLR